MILSNISCSVSQIAEFMVPATSFSYFNLYAAVSCLSFSIQAGRGSVLRSCCSQASIEHPTLFQYCLVVFIFTILYLVSAIYIPGFIFSGWRSFMTYFKFIN